LEAALQVCLHPPGRRGGAGVAEAPARRAPLVIAVQFIQQPLEGIIGLTAVLALFEGLPQGGQFENDIVFPDWNRTKFNIRLLFFKLKLKT
jgi:hypothetical protein